MRRGEHARRASKVPGCLVSEIALQLQACHCPHQLVGRRLGHHQPATEAAMPHSQHLTDAPYDQRALCSTMIHYYCLLCTVCALAAVPLLVLFRWHAVWQNLRLPLRKATECINFPARRGNKLRRLSCRQWRCDNQFITAWNHQQAPRPKHMKSGTHHHRQDWNACQVCTPICLVAWLAQATPRARKR